MGGAGGADYLAVDDRALVLQLDNFIGDHPLGWIAELSQAVRESVPQGNFINVFDLATALPNSLSEHTRR